MREAFDAKDASRGKRRSSYANVQHGKYFRVAAEVWIDGESLADTP